MKVALVGNPNSGKSSLFNALTGLNQTVGNFPGVTVDKKTGHFSIDEKQIELIDLPGTYSLYPKSLDEEVVFNVLGNPQNKLHPDVIVLLADASNLKRNLLFITQIIDLKIPTILALNMMDIAEKEGIEINQAGLEQDLGIQIISINARKAEGLKPLKKAILKAQKQSVAPTINPQNYAADLIEEIRKTKDFKSDYAAFQFIQNFQQVQNIPQKQKTKLSALKAKYNLDFKQIQAKETIDRYQKIAGIMARNIKRIKETSQRSRIRLTKRIDKILTHNVLGYVIFLLIFFLIFQAIYEWASFPMDAIERGFGEMKNWFSSVLPNHFLSNLWINGILAGLEGVVIFIPQIAILFAFIAILEDTGYMARVSFLMDNLMRKFGMNGKSVVPLVSGFACAIPAIMATRNINSWKERILTIMITPLMSCSARLPVYTLLIALVIPDKTVLGFFNLQGLVLMFFYFLGFFTGMLVALVLKWIVKAKNHAFFILELPIYRSPRWKNIGRTMFDKSKAFVLEAGKVIFVVSIVLWLLASFGPGDSFKNIEQKYAQELSSNQITESQVEEKMAQEKLEKSYAGRLGKLIEPAIEPLGYDWKIGIALITSFAAREVFVGTMSTIYSLGGDDSDEAIPSLKQKMLADKKPNGEPIYTFATAFSLMIFYAFAMQCMSTIAITYKETGGWKWAILQFLYMTILAYLASLVAFQLLK